MDEGVTVSAGADGGAHERGDVIVTPEGRFAELAAACIAEMLREACERSGRPRVSIALAGGTTPRSVYDVLATAAAVEWRRLDVYFGDERAVPPDDPDSNYRMARESLLDRVPVPPERIHPMNAVAASLAAAAREYAALLPDPLDVLLLGIGSDCHTASLFPGSDPARERVRLVVPAASPAHPHRRLTVTPMVLRHARRIAVLASGRGKAGAVARALSGSWNPVACPAQLARRGRWVLDPGAASLLDGGPVRVHPSPAEGGA